MSGSVVASKNAPVKSVSAIRVMVADDSAVIRGIVSRWIDADKDMTVVAAAVNGQDAVDKAKTAKPDIIVLDIEMPVMDGISALPLLLKACPGAKIIMASTLTRRNAEISLKALSLGATDYVPKPTSVGGGEAAEEFRRELMSRITALGRTRYVSGKATGAASVSGGKGAALTLRKASMAMPQILAIGSSTGGPQALMQVVSAIAPQLNVPVLITQHMPATFTAILAESLTRSSGIPCVEGANGMKLEPGHVYLAPGDFHMTIKGKGGPIELSQSAPENFCRPAVDPMFRSIAAAYGPSTLGVVLTGMGADGREGARAIASVSGTTLAQDEATSVVWGMPAAVAQAGLASAVLPLASVGQEIRKYLGLKPR
jgi:two-component system, chemotaxis family, protein-glutamate methylesterase/glutaminase